MLFTGVLVAILWSTSAWTIILAAVPLTAVYYSLRNTVTLETQTIEARARRYCFGRIGAATPRSLLNVMNEGFPGAQ